MLSKKIVLINYKMGNLKSVCNAFKFLNYDIEITDNKQKIKSSIGIVMMMFFHHQFLKTIFLRVSFILRKVRIMACK